MATSAVSSAVKREKKVWQPFFSKCKSLKSFEEVIEKTYRMYKRLKPGGQMLQVNDENDETVQEYFHGVVISLLATWEEFILSIMREAYDFLYKSEQSLQGLKEIWPQCEDLIKMTIKRRNQPEEDAFKILMEEVSWKSLLEDHRDNVLDTRLIPVFKHGDRGIDKLFTSLFQFKRTPPNPPTMRHPPTSSTQLVTISETILEQFEEIKYEYLEDVLTLTCDLKTASEINDLLRLYYGARCIFAHGNATLTFQKNGVLSTPILKGQAPGQKHYVYIAKKLSKLYDRLKNDKRKTHLSYTDLITMFRYFRRIARRTMIAIAIQVQKCTQRECNLWGINETLPEDSLVCLTRKRALTVLEEEEDDKSLIHMVFEEEDDPQESSEEDDIQD